MQAYLIAAAIAASTIAVPSAAAADQVRRDVPVEYADLDLSTRVGMVTLDRRLRRAVADACGSAHHFDIEQQQDLARCLAAARERAEAARSVILARARAIAPPPALAAR